MLVMTLPWHWLGLNGQWRRVAHFDYSDPAIAWWGPWVVVSLIGGILLVRAHCCSSGTWCGCTEAVQASRAAPDSYACRFTRPARVPASLNGFTLWNVLVLVLMLVAYGWPVAQFAVNPSPGAVIHRVSGAG